MQRALTCALALACALACEEQPPAKPAPAASAKPASASTCRTETGELERWAREAVADGAGPPKPVKELGIALVEHAGGERWPFFGTAVYLTKDKMQLDFGEPAPANDEAARKKLLDELRANVQSAISAGMAPKLDVFADASTPWSTIVSLLGDAAKAGVRNVGFSFSAPSKVQAPESEASDAEKVFASCDAAKRALAALDDEMMSQKEKSEKLAARIPASLATCNCKPSVGEAKGVLWTWLGRRNGAPVSAMELRLAAPNDAKAARVSAKPDATWKDAHAALLAKAKEGEPLVLEAKP